MPSTGLRPARYANITTATTTTVKSGAGVLRRIVINAGVASTITIYDSLTGSGTKIGTLAASAGPGSFSYEIGFNAGLTIVTAGASDLTVCFE
jgi:hypothetical protein